MILVDRITFAYPQNTPIFKGYCWRADRGDAWAILGPSGCGKTTFLYLLAGLRVPQAGSILINGRPVIRPRPHTGLILQDYGLLPWATVRQNVELGLRVRRFYGPDGTHAPADFRPADPSRLVDEWLARVGLSEVADKYPAQISGGQRQRTAIARTFVLQPDLLLMDEPFSSLDALTREDLQDLTFELCAEGGITLIVVTHAIEEAAYLGKKILLIGQPPNTRARVVENAEAGQVGFRDSAAYAALCRELRLRLEGDQQ